jgi:hypothetical protein
MSAGRLTDSSITTLMGGRRGSGASDRRPDCHGVRPAPREQPGCAAELRGAGQLRLDHPNLSLTALAKLAKPPLIQDALHG